MTAQIIQLSQHQEDSTEINAVKSILADFEACLTDQDKADLKALQEGDLEVQDSLLKD